MGYENKTNKNHSKKLRNTFNDGSNVSIIFRHNKPVDNISNNFNTPFNISVAKKELKTVQVHPRSKERAMKTDKILCRECLKLARATKNAYAVIFATFGFTLNVCRLLYHNLLYMQIPYPCLIFVLALCIRIYQLTVRSL